MSEQTFTGTLYDNHETLKRFRYFENRYYQEVAITKVCRECPFGHQEGETYKVTNCNSDGLCGALYQRIHDSIVTLHYWGSLPWEKNPDQYVALCEGRLPLFLFRFYSPIHPFHSTIRISNSAINNPLHQPICLQITTKRLQTI